MATVAAAGAASASYLVVFGFEISNNVILAGSLGLFGLLLCLYLIYNTSRAKVMSGSGEFEGGVLGAGGSIDLTNYRYDVINNKKLKICSIINNDLWIETPLIKSEWLSTFLGNNCNVTLKLDCLQPCGTYKIRGISSFMKSKYLLNKNIDTFITTSSSNTGIAVAYISNKLNCKCLLILPENKKKDEYNVNSMIYKIKCEYEFVEFQYYGTTWNECDEYAVKLGEHESSKYCYVPIFDDPTIFDGYSSIIRELNEQYINGYGGINDNYPDCICISVNNGDLLTGIIGGLFQVGWSRQCKIIAAQSENNSLLEYGINNSFNPIPMRAISCIGKEIGHRSVCKKSLQLVQKLKSFNPLKSIIVKDLDILNCCTLFAKKHNILLQPNSAIAITALYKNKQYFKQFNNICVIIQGGNNTYYNISLLNNSLQRGLFDDKTTKFDVINTHNINQQKTNKKYKVIDTIYQNDSDNDDDEQKDDSAADDDQLNHLFDEDIDHYDSQSEEM